MIGVGFFLRDFVPLCIVPIASGTVMIIMTSTATFYPCIT